MKIKTSSALKTLHAIFYITLIIFALLYLLPFWGALTTSLKSAQEVAESNPLLLPNKITLTGYIDAFKELGKPLFNSLIITLGGTLGSVFFGSVCGYALSKYRFKFDNIFFILLVIGIYIPYQSILVPLFRTLSTMGAHGTALGLILVHTVYGMPMCTVMFRGFYSDVPNVIIRQATIDGNGPWQIYRKIVLPSTMIATVTVMVFQFTSIWNEMLFALIIGGVRFMPATRALNNMMGTLGAVWNVQMAGAIMLALPILIIYIIMGKYLIRGYMAGTVTAS